MRPIHEFNAAANRYLADYASQVRCLRRNIESRVTAVQEAVAHSRALMVKADALIAEVTREAGCGLRIDRHLVSPNRAPSGETAPTRRSSEPKPCAMRTPAG
jgi:hypothetical protein